MHAADDQHQSEAAGARRWNVERHNWRGQRLPAAPQALKLAWSMPNAGAAGLKQAIIRIVLGEQKTPRASAGHLRGRSSPPPRLLTVQASDFEPQAAHCRGMGRIGPL
jgi:hypothetical protein